MRFVKKSVKPQVRKAKKFPPKDGGELDNASIQLAEKGADQQILFSFACRIAANSYLLTSLMAEPTLL